MATNRARNTAEQLTDTARGPQLVEEGNAFRQLSGLATKPRNDAAESYDAIVIGAGQAGLAVGYFLQKRGLKFLILDGNARIGDSWRKRWDSLRLFSPAALDGLPGKPFPAARDYFPTKDEMGDYLESYAQHFALPVRMGMKVERVSKQDGRYFVEAGGQRFCAAHVVVAMGGYQRPNVPELAQQLDPAITQFHSSLYKNPSQLKPGPVLLVGGGNSGAELGAELSKTHKVYMAGRDNGNVPFEVRSWLGRNVLEPMLMRIVFHRILTTSTPIGRKARPHIISKGGPLIRTKASDLAKAGVERTPKVVGVQNGQPVLEDGRTLEVTNVIWCTGYHPSHDWIDLPVFDEDHRPKHDRGVVQGEEGLYFVGLPFLYAMSSAMIHGVARDAEHVVKAIGKRHNAAAKA